MLNPYRALLDLLPQTPVQLGTVLAEVGGTVQVAIEGSGTIWARGSATIGATVYVRDGAVEGTAPSLPLELIEV